MKGHFLTDEDKNKIKMMAEYCIAFDATVRQVGKMFNCSKSKVHYNFKYHLADINKELYNGVRAVAEKNLRERAERGGEATRLKYAKMKE